jgi:PBP1b-binding outer membrane lipoprotein LpoB
MKKIITIIALAIILASCSAGHKLTIDACPTWANNIKNPENLEFVEEVAFNLNKPVSQVTQQEFNNRYLNN